MRLQIYILNFLTAFIAFTCFVPTATAQIDRWGYWENGVSEAWSFSPEQFSQKQADDAIAKWNQIGAVSKTDEWSGDYFRGDDTHGTFLRWSKSGFVIVDVDKCAARVMGLSYGRVYPTEPLIRFNPEFENWPQTQHSHGSSKGVPSLVPVKWRGSSMLIAENEMAEFGDYVAGLGRFGYGEAGYFLSVPFYNKLKEKNSVEDKGPPQVPRGYDRFIKAPVAASITAVKSKAVRKTYSYENPDGTGGSYYEPVSLTTVTVDVGSDRGLKRGMFLYSVSPHEGDSVRLIRVGKLTSTGIIIRDMTDGKEMFFDANADQQRPHSKVQTGWRLTTSPLR